MPARLALFDMAVRIVSAAIVCVVALASTAGAQTGDPPVTDWQRRLTQAEWRLRRLPTGDAVGRERLGAEVAQLRQEISSWLASFPPAQGEAETWLDSPETPSDLEGLAAELGRLRAALSRIAAAVGGAGGTGAFYLGRVDVAVSADTTTTATTEMTPAGASVLVAADLQANDRPSLAGALALAPGVTFTRSGSRNETGVYVRGFDMRQVPLFVDGIPIYTPYDGYVDLERFTTFDVAELRVSKGFASVLYGPNALGGAINIVSRRPSGRLEGQAGAAYGNGEAGSVYLNVGSRMGAFYLQGGASYLDAATFPLAGGFEATKNQPAGDRVNAYKQDAKFNVKLGWTPRRGDEYAVSYVGQRGEKGNPPYAGIDPSVRVRYWQWPYWDKDSLYFVSNTSLGASSYVRGRAFYDTYANALHSYDDGTFTTMTKSSSFRSLYDDRTVGASLEWGVAVGRHRIRAAGHVKQDQHQDHNSGEPPKRFDGRILSFGIEDSWVVGARLSLVAGISGDWQATTRAEDYQKGQVIDLLAGCQANGSSCGDASGVNPQVGLFYSLPTGLVRLTLARKTRMPSLKDRYSYKMGTAVPNPDLKAEHNLTVEGGYQGTLGARTSFQLSVFYSRIDDLVQRFYLQPNLSTNRNVGEASAAGIEVDARTRLLPRVDLGGNYTHLRRENISDPTIPLLDAPEHKGRVAATATVTPWMRVIAAVDFEAGRRTQNDAGTYLDVPSFATASLKGSWTVFRKVTAELALLNAFDKDYWVAEGYPEAGRTMVATVRYAF